MSKDKYIPTNARGFNAADTAHFMRKMKEVTTISVIEQLQNKLAVGNIYSIRTQYRTDESRHPTYIEYTPMECVGIYPHMAVFRPTEGRYRFTVAYSYTELCTGVLEGANELMNGVLPYEEEELVDEEIENA